MSVIDYCKHEDTFGENAKVNTDKTNKTCSVLKFFTSLKTNLKKYIQQIVHSQEM